MAKIRSRDIGMGRWSDAAIRRLGRLHKDGSAGPEAVAAVKRPPEVAKCSGYFVWSVRQAGFVGRHDGSQAGSGRHYVTCTAHAKRYASVAQARAAGEMLAGDVLIMYGYAANTPLYAVGR